MANLSNFVANENHVMNDALNNSAIKKKFTEFLETGNYRKTPERFAILKKTLSFSNTFTIEQLNAQLEDEAYHVSRATVYNTVELLTKAGILHKLCIEGLPTQYEKVTSVNYTHLICKKCGKIKNVKDSNLERYMNAIKFNAFQSSFYVMCVYGVCNACARKIKKNNIQKQ